MIGVQRICGRTTRTKRVSPDSEEIEPTVAKPQGRNFPSVEQIQDSEEGAEAEAILFGSDEIAENKMRNAV